MKRYIVTEDQLEELQNAAFDLGKEWCMWTEPLKSMAAQDLSDRRNECRTFEVPDWATHFAESDWCPTKFQEILKNENSAVD